MVNFCIDKGNTRIKIAVFVDNELVFDAIQNEINYPAFKALIDKFKPSACILSNVGSDDLVMKCFLQSEFAFFLEFDSTTPVPIKNAYKSPQSLGKDRLAAAVGAAFIKPNSNILVVDAGTAITYDFVDAAGVYHGGNIAPGLNMRLKALNEFTINLPLVELVDSDELLGFDTNSAILLGVLKGIEFEINGYFKALNFKYPELSIFLTGGNSNYFVSKLKSPIFAQKNLVLTGLNRILQFNVKK